MGSLKDLVGKSVYLDANVFVYFLEGHPELADLAGLVFAEIDLHASGMEVCLISKLNA